MRGGSLSKKSIHQSKNILPVKSKQADKINKRKGHSYSQSNLKNLHNMSHNRSVDDYSSSDKLRSKYHSLRKTHCTSLNSKNNSKQKIIEERESSVCRKSSTPLSKNKINFIYSFRTKQGILATNPNKTNQDRLLVKTKMGKNERNLFVVADGHGSHGHFVAESVVQSYMSSADKYFNTSKSTE